MRMALPMSALLVLLLAAADLKPQAMPMMRSVDPYTVKVGAEVLAAGENLGSNTVAEVYIGVNGKNTKVEVISQTEKEVKFKVPKVGAGSYRVLVLTKGAEPVIIEEPVKLVVEE
jgi:hypothetical protein